MLESFEAILLNEYSLSQWVLVFFLYSFAGWCWEVALYVVKERRFVNRGFLTGPILPIYGFGALSILLTCMPVKQSVLAVAILGTVMASLLELITGFVMESLFNVRYWDYSHKLLNLNGYICLMSSCTWAVFSVVIVCVVHPFIQPYVRMVPTVLASVASGTLCVFALIDTVFAVRRALDLRALLESMERYAKELEAVHGGLDSISDRVAEMIRAFAERVDSTQEAARESMERIAAARDRVNQMIREKRINLEEGTKERFANFERILNDIAGYLPDISTLLAEVQAAKEQYDRKREALVEARACSIKRAQRTLRGNPSASSRRYSGELEMLRRRSGEEQARKKEKRTKKRA